VLLLGAYCQLPAGHTLRLALCALLFAVLASTPQAEAGFASRFTFSFSEEFNDNIFFEEQKEGDFITSLIPEFTLLFAPLAHEIPTFTANIRSPIQIYANNSDRNNFAQNIALDAGYIYNYSPRLIFRLTSDFRRVGETRTTGRDDFGNAADLVTSGSRLDTGFGVDADFLYSPRLSFTGGFAGDYNFFLDEGGEDTTNSFKFKGQYKWKKAHTLFGAYSVDFFSPRSAEDENVVSHNFDIGDDFFSNRKIKLTPTLSLFTSGGISIASAKDGNEISSRSNIRLTKVWQKALVSAGLRRGLTNSFGVSGISKTTSFFTAGNIRLTEALSVSGAVTFSLFDTDDDDFNTFESQAAFQYRFKHWLSTSLRYTYRRRDREREDTINDIINGNSIFLFFTTQVDTWPNFGLPKAFRRQSPALRNPTSAFRD